MSINELSSGAFINVNWSLLLFSWRSELAAELMSSNDQGEVDEWNDGSADTPDADWQNWMPDPVDADPAKSSKQRRLLTRHVGLILIRCWRLELVPVD